MLIEIKNKDCYQSWIRYYERHNINITAVERTDAFIKSNNNEYPRCTCMGCDIDSIATMEDSTDGFSTYIVSW
jgi:hypothetical protein